MNERLHIELVGSYFSARVDEDGEGKLTFRVVEESQLDMMRVALQGKKKALKLIVEEATP